MADAPNDVDDWLGQTIDEGPDEPFSAAPAPVRRKRSKRRIAARCAVVLSVLVLVLGLFAYASVRHYDSKISRIDAFHGLNDRPAVARGSGTNFLLLGSDDRTGLTAAEQKEYRVGSNDGGTSARSDTIILVHLSADRSRATIVSFPRDSLVEIPTHVSAEGRTVAEHRAKINAAFAAGGPPLTVATVEHATGIHIDHYVQVNFLGFARMVGAVGGVDVCLNRAVKDKNSGLDLPAGISHVGPIQALAFVRARHLAGDGGDLGRVKRQQLLLAAMAKEATNPAVVLNPWRLNGLLDAVTSAVKVDDGLSYGDMRSLAMAVHGLDPAHVQYRTVPVSDPGYWVRGLGSTVRWDETDAGALFQAMRKDQPAPPPTHQGTAGVAGSVQAASATTRLSGTGSQAASTGPSSSGAPSAGDGAQCG